VVAAIIKTHSTYLASHHNSGIEAVNQFFFCRIINITFLPGHFLEDKGKYAQKSILTLILSQSSLPFYIPMSKILPHFIKIEPFYFAHAKRGESTPVFLHTLIYPCFLAFNIISLNISHHNF
jgi:hypothetical protein